MWPKGTDRRTPLYPLRICPFSKKSEGPSRQTARKHTHWEKKVKRFLDVVHRIVIWICSLTGNATKHHTHHHKQQSRTKQNKTKQTTKQKLNWS